MGNKILVVDDDKGLHRLMGLMLPAPKYETLFFAECRAACDFMKQEANRDLSIIITDLIMPEMDGVHLMREIRSNYPLWRVPIIAATGRGINYENLEKGFTDILPKPFTLKEIREKVDKYLINPQS